MRLKRLMSMLILYTPLPQANTGTATYAAALLEELLVEAGPSIRDRTVIAVDAGAVEDQGGAARSQGWKVRDHRGITTTRSDVCAYFLASNHYHYYSYEQLALHTRGRAVGVIHDLSAGYMLRNMSTHFGSAYSGSLARIFRYDFGCRATSLHWYYDMIHYISRHFITAQGVTLEKCHDLIVHSYYAKAKLMLDTGFAEEAQKIRVCAHPAPLTASHLTAAPALRPRAAGSYRVGSLGYYFPMKRFPAIVSAWSAFQSRRDTDSPCELLLGGDVPQKEKRKLLELCDERFRHTIQFPGFLGEGDLHRTMQSLDLAISLRFPSNGETSGIVAHCLAYNVPIAISEFAAFREEPAAFRISVSPEREVGELTSALEEGYDTWRRGERLVNKPPTWLARKPQLTHCLLEAVE
jgi:hypothetical protein